MKPEHTDTTLRIRSMTKATDLRRGKMQQISSKTQTKLRDLCTEFASKLPKDGSSADYNKYYQTYDTRWRLYCNGQMQKYDGLQLDVQAFSNRVSIAQNRSMRQSKPLIWLWHFHVKRYLPFVALAGGIYLLTEYVWPMWQELLKHLTF